MDKKLLTIAEAALAMGIGRSLLYRLVMTGEIRSVVVGGRARRIPVTALDEWIARQQAEAQADGGQEQLTPFNQSLSSRRPSDA